VTIGDRVWIDLDLDGIQDSGEPGLSGVTVQLWIDDNGDGTPDTQVNSTTTNSTGGYQFTLGSVQSGKQYIVKFVLPSGRTFTTANAGSDDNLDSDANITSGLTSGFNLTPGTTNNSIDAGVKPNASLDIEKSVYKGHNNGTTCPGQENINATNGEQITYCFVITNTGETYVNNISLTDALLGLNINITTTSLSGQTLAPGGKVTYAVQTTFKATWLTSDADNNATTATNSASISGQPSSATGNALSGYPAVTDTNTATVTSKPLSTIGDVVWQDSNENGIQDTGEPGLPGYRVELWVDSNNDGTPDQLVANVTTTTGGKYEFTNLDPDKKYYVKFQVSNTTTESFTTANAGSDDNKDSDANPSNGFTGLITLVAGEPNNSVDAGIKIKVAGEVNDVKVVKAVDKTTVKAGDNLTYNLTVTNSNKAAATNVVVTDSLNANLEIVSVTAQRGTVTTSGNVITVNIGNMNISESVTITIVAKVKASTPVTTVIPNVASVSANGGTQNNSNEVRSTVTPNGLPNTGLRGANIPNETFIVLSLLTLFGLAFITYGSYRKGFLMK
jgi:uncharacterized repeat protein (TIGR01451 family)